MHVMPHMTLHSDTTLLILHKSLPGQMNTQIPSKNSQSSRKSRLNRRITLFFFGEGTKVRKELAHSWQNRYIINVSYDHSEGPSRHARLKGNVLEVSQGTAFQVPEID